MERQKEAKEIEHIDFEKVRALSKQYNMDGKDVYDMYSKYNSMHELAKMQVMGATASD
jgi:hypothetical protein